MEESDCNEDFVAVRLNEICRSCLLKTGENMSNLCEKTDNVAVLITMLSSIANVEIEINELLPSYLCAPCEDKLKSCYEFQQQLHRSEEIIRQCFIEDKIDVKDDELVDLIDIEETLVVFEPEEKKAEIKNVEKPEVTIELRTRNKKKRRLSQFPHIEVQVAIEEAKSKFDEHFLHNVTCIVCGFQSSNARALSAHMTFLHKGEKENWCSICNAMVGDLPKHMKSLHSHTQHKCKFCGRCMKSRSHFLEHLRSHGSIRPYQCTFCNKSFMSSSRLVCHKRLHTAKDMLECPCCKKTFNRLANLQYHVKTHKGSTCSKCSKHFESAELFEAHACDNSEEVPEAPPPVAASDECASVSLTDPQNFCNKCNRRVRSLKTHIDKHHSDKQIEADASNVATCLCAVCGKQCRSNGKLKIHMRVHTGELPYKCAHCDRRTSSRHQLVVHERTHTGEKPHACAICGRAFAQSSVLNTHMKIHTGRPEQCDICKKRFCRPAQLKLHLRKHTGEKPYSCSVCAQGFRQKSHLVDHERTHSDDRPFTCTYCYKGFKQKTTLRSHLQIHMDKRPFKCSQCPYACRQSHSLTMHMKQHEADAPREDKPHLCVICQRGFNTRAMLTSHVGQVHQSMRVEIGTIHFPVIWHPSIQGRLRVDKENPRVVPDMLFTVCYAYATVMQWWRLRSLKLKLNGTLNPQNSLLVCSGSSIHDQRKHRCLENLLFKHDDRIACTVVPKPKVNLAHWIAFPKNLRCFPIHIDVNHHLRLDGGSGTTGGTIFVLVQAVLDKYTKHHSDIVQIEDYGELMGWRASDGFELVLKTDIDHLTKLIHRFVGSSVDMNHELQILKIETVDVEGSATAIKYDKTYLQEQTLKYSYAPVHWNNFVAEIKELYGKLRDVTNPKIKIENGSPKCSEALDLEPSKSSSSSKKQDAKKANTLEVTAGGDHRRHKHSEHKSQQAKPEKKNQVVVKSAKAMSETPSTSKSKAPATSTSSSQSGSKIEVVKTKSEVNKKEEKSAREEVAKKSNNKKVVEEKTDVAVASTSKNGSVPKATAPKKEQRKTKPSKVASSTSSKAENGEVPRKPKLVKDKSVGGVGDMPSCSFSNLKNVKPPNVLVYSDSIVTKDNVKRVLYSILNKEKYTVYDLPTSSKHMSWDRSTVLVVVCGTVPPEMTSHLIQYLLNGGQLLCLCSDLMYSVLHTFTTAEVREHELVRFSYGSWESVKMMHHIFCYQASPAKKQFSKDSDQSNHSSNGSSPLAPRTPSNVELRHNEKDYNIQVQVLGTEETWQTPSLLLAKVKDSEGRAVFSQVHLEIDPDEYENDEAKYEFLKSSNQARLEILKDILSTHLDLVCDDNFGIVAYSPGYFLGRYDLKMNMLSGCENISENQMNADKISVVFCGNNVDPGIASNIRLPVLIHSCPSNFSTVDYFETLDTEHIGRLVIYTDIMTSSQHVFTKKLRHGLVVIPRQQTNGTGRSSNNWISPLGSANYSLQMHIPLNSPIGQSLSIIQHLVMVATVLAVRTIPGYEAVPLGIKWPNDLYANGKVKVGGLVVNSILIGDTAIVNVGCGVNLSNKNPTTCVNDVIAKSNGRLKPIPYEKYFAMVFNQLEKLYDSVQSSNLDHLMDLYYQYWLHSDAEVSIQATEKGNPTKAKIIGIDNYGFLSVRLEDGTLTTVQPDGNSFDMMTGLIAPKLF